MTQLKVKNILFSSYFRHLKFLRILFFISGACGLIYEVMWLKTLGLVFGNTTYAATSVLSGFMLGLGSGAFVFGRISDQHKNPLKLYAVLELGIGLYAFATPVLWAVIQFGFVNMVWWIPMPAFVITLIKFIFSILFLFIPTFFMGGTLPVLVNFLRFQKLERQTNIVPSLYAINTVGAVCGVFLSGFVLPPWIGIWQTVYVAGIANVIVFLGVCAMVEIDFRNFSRLLLWWMKDSVLAVRKFKCKASIKNDTLPLFLFALTGFVSMACELGWTRVLALTLGSSTYAFSVMLITFLTGISVGSWLFGFFTTRMRVNLVSFGLIQALVACSIFISLKHVNELPYYFLRGFEIVGEGVWRVEVLRFLLCSVVILPSTILMGSAFACFVAAQKHSRNLEDELGIAYLINTVGAVLGTVLAGFILIPLLGIQTCLVLAALVSSFISIAACMSALRNWILRFVIVGVCIAVFVGCYLQVKPWNRNVISSGLSVSLNKAKGAKKTDLSEYFSQNMNLFYKEGLESIVSVSRFKDQLMLHVNGKVDASNGDDAFNQYLLGHLPLFLKPDAKKVLIIGLGSGSTNAAVSAHTVEQIDTVEIEQSVVQAAQFFSQINRNVLSDKRNRIFINDGRNYLLTTRQKYDVIISEPSNPWMAGVANLFSLEHYQLMKDRLQDRGIACQWVHAYSMSQDDLKMIVRTFANVFEQVNIWTSFYPDLILLGSRHEMVFDFDIVKQLWTNPDIKNDFSPFGVERPEGFFSGFWLGDSEVRALGGSGRLNTDNYPHLEYSAPKYLYSNTFQSNLELVNSFRAIKYPQIKNMNPSIEKNANFHLAMARGYVSRTMLVEAVSELRLASDLNADDVALLTQLGILEFKRKNYIQAKDFFMRAVEKGGERLPAELCYFLGLVFKESGDWRDASQYFAKAMKVDPENAAYLFELAHSYRNEKLWMLSVPLFEKVLNSKGIQASQLRFDSWVGLLDGLSQVGTIERQISVLQDASREFPNILQFREALGRGYEAGGKLDRAREIFEANLRDFPTKWSTYTNLARIYERLGLPAEVKRVIATLVRLNPSLASDPEIAKILNR